MKNDVLKVKLKLNEILLNKTKLDNGKTLAKMVFCQHLGIAYDSTLVLNEVMAIDENPKNLYIEKSNALKKRNEYALLALTVRAEKVKTRMKLGEYLPQAGVGIAGMYIEFDKTDNRTLKIDEIMKPEFLTRSNVVKF